MNEIRDPLDRAIDDSLARSFTVPQDPAAPLAELLEERSPAPAPVSRNVWPMALATAAAVLLFLFTLDRGKRLQGLSSETHSDIAHVDADGRVRTPDLATLYYEISTALDDPFLCPTPEGLAGELAESYDCCDELRAHPHVADLLEGPFDSTQWPTGTILTGKADDSTAVLIADLDSTYSCCVRPEMPEDSELEVFTMRLGDLVLTEVTPLSEPRLLDYFSWGEELR